MSPTGRTSAPTSEDFDATRGDVEDLNEEADARGADAFEDAREEIRIGFPDDLRFNPSDQATMEQHDQLQLIRQLQADLAVMKTQLAAKAPSMSDTSMESAPPSPKKPKIKDVRCSNFKGNEGYPGLGAGFENFIHEFEHAIRAEGLVNGSTWTNDLKASVIVNYLEGKASRYYHKKSSEWQRRHDGENMPYSEVKRAMRAEFGCKLSQLELSTKMRCNKRESDSWHDYLEYLNFIEGLMEGDQTKLVMEVFGNHACPELAATLLAAVPEDTTDYATESDRMKRLLDHRNENSNGVRGQKRNNNQKEERSWRNHKSNDEDSDKQSRQQNNGQAFAAASGNRHQIRCHVCNQLGHKIFTCPVVEQAKKLASTTSSAHVATATDNTAVSTGSVNTATAEEVDSSYSSDSDDEAHVWVAASTTDSANFFNSNVWTIDSGATHHLCMDREQLFAITPAFLSVRVANGNVELATEKGSTVVTTTTRTGEKHTVLLKNVYYAKGIDRNLMSVAQLTQKGYSCEFGKDLCTVRVIRANRLLK
ncbi:hypothetical protein GN958_ATG09820 [Phytophthora infestans]|uniref:Retrovirus-related Pol polyprotein from transposon TNT 1-94-like beta-barrel domain-containing protein n=1 Tax=Phytophthora infestans TaxID=4787 RepID=A0A8S9UNH7_PHYIN|nr:hypothetical protein GN958_ATG09820 [Phytophthora infestans]